MKTTCFDCTKKQKQFCRSRSIAKNSNICELVQKNKFDLAKKKLSG